MDMKKNLQEEFENWYRTSEDVGSKPTSDFWLQKMLEHKERLIKEVGVEVEKLRPAPCNCIGAKYECEHWGRHETCDEVLDILRRLQSV
jgi:hypothetical protein